jgi:hypothetical protein
MRMSNAEGERAGDWVDLTCTDQNPFVCEGAVIAGCVDAGAYTVCTDLATQASARDACNTGGGALVSIESASEDDEVFELASALIGASAVNVWIGGAESVEGEWKWPTGAAIPAPPFSAWAIDEPNSFFGDEDCVFLDANVTDTRNWFDTPCVVTMFPIVCENVADPSCTTITGTAFSLCNTTATGGNARAICQARGGDAAHVRDHESNAAITAAAASIAQRWWIGATDFADEGTWVWVDDQSVFEIEVQP